MAILHNQQPKITLTAQFYNNSRSFQYNRHKSGSFYRSKKTWFFYRNNILDMVFPLKQQTKPDFSIYITKLWYAYTSLKRKYSIAIQHHRELVYRREAEQPITKQRVQQATPCGFLCIPKSDNKFGLSSQFYIHNIIFLLNIAAKTWPLQ